jgi:hypothetical protein
VDGVLVYFDEAIDAPDGVRYDARACAREMEDGRWCGWLEFSFNGGDWRATDVETVQPNRRDVDYWVTGLTRVYLEGALVRALDESLGRRRARERVGDPGIVTHEANDRRRTSPIASNAPRTILDPFSVFAQGEGILRAQLAALHVDQVRNIAAAFNIESPETASALSATELRERIVAAARRHLSRASNPELRA